ncbi:class I SAM-dependent methyltransferase [Plectonema radiosum NIES-515]|uniref:Class I SAM-dependent methyltransferase n=1 Tax=Plectonema radiosum NIES-515 TaxID=2986073 RepID=A0ABT3AVC7_9CYAN|nr:class I SAM-dependent methyltransferase [Plectonema radiosum]MCV3213048.1 class I SAM-dependent methyltransferase [Plectonema radiosum NIES-515]
MQEKLDKLPNWNELIKDYSAAGQQNFLERRPDVWVFGYIPEVDLLSRYVDSNSKILDFGCGNGKISRYVKDRLSCEPIGVDVNPEAIDRAKSFNDGIQYFVIKENEIPDSPVPFDACISNHVFPTYANHDAIVATLQAIRKTLKSGAPLIIYVDNTKYTGVKYTTFMGGVPEKKYSSGEPLPMRIYLGDTQIMDFHDYFWSPEDYLEAIKLAGYTDPQVIFSQYDAVNVKKYEEYFGLHLSEEFENEKLFSPCAIYSGRA